MFHAKNEKFEPFEDLFHTMLKMQPEMNEAMEIKHDETRGNITVEEGDLSVNERNIDRQTHTHHKHKDFTINAFALLGNY